MVRFSESNWRTTDEGGQRKENYQDQKGAIRTKEQRKNGNAIDRKSVVLLRRAKGENKCEGGIMLNQE